MATLCDVNLLLAGCYDRHLHHPVALAWLDKQDELSLVICRQTQLGLLRLLTNSAVMGADVCTLMQAWEVYETILSDERFDFYAEPLGLEPFLRKYTQIGRVSPKFWQDAYLAAFARAGKLHLATFDEGFRHFEALRLILPG